MHIAFLSIPSPSFCCTGYMLNFSKYIGRTLSRALPSLSVNGLDASPSLLAPETSNADRQDPPSTPPEGDTNYEPYDPRLGAKLRDLYAQLEQESTRVAELRRDAPGAAARAYMERLETELETERVAEMEKGRRGDDASHVDLRESLKFGNLAEVERMWGKGTDGLAELEKLPEVLAKLERATTVAEVVEGM